MPKYQISTNRTQNITNLPEERGGPEAPASELFLSFLPFFSALGVAPASKHNTVPQGLWLSRRTSVNRS